MRWGIFLLLAFLICAGPGDFIYPFSELWREYLAEALTKRKAKLVASEQGADYIVSGRFWVEGGALVVNTRLVRVGRDEYTVERFCRVEMPLEESWLALDLSVYAKVAAAELLRRRSAFQQMPLVAEPLRLRGVPLYPPFSRLFMDEVKTFLAARGVRFMEAHILSSTFRSFRGIAVRKGLFVDPAALRFLRLSGSLWPEGEKVRVFLKIVGLEGKLLAQARVLVPKAVVPEGALEVGETWTPGAIEANRELALHLLPDRGRGAVYSGGERIFFTLWLNRDAYVHIYDCDPEGKITLLYPCAGDTGRLLGRRLHFLPQEVEWTISPPFGADRVLAFASVRPIRPPVRLDCGEEVPLSLGELYQYYRRETAMSPYAEEVATVVTRP